MQHKMKTIWPGVMLCFGIAALAWGLGSWVPLVGSPVFAMILGMILTLFLRDGSRLVPGIAFVSKRILQTAVVLLGFGLNLSVIAATGVLSLPVIFSTITAALLTAFVLHKILQTPANSSVLIGVGSAICGGSAIAATAPVISAKEEEIAHAISVIFLFNVLAALIFPTLGGMLGLTDDGFGLFAGTAVNDTSSVTAAASAWDAIHGGSALEVATIVKLTRTLAIIPITMGLALYRRKQQGTAGVNVSLAAIFPYFILLFFLASVITTGCTLLGVPGSMFVPMKTLSKFFIVMAMAAIGLRTHMGTLIRSGGKPILMGFCCWVGVAAVSLLVQYLMGIW